MTTPIDQPPAPAETTAPVRRPLWPWLAGGGVLVIAVAVTAVLLFGGGGEPAPDLAAGATKACTQEYVPDRLTSPATAEWSDIEVDQDGDTYYRVTGSVDSENAFGAMVRSTWDCYVARDGDGWRAVEVALKAR